MINIDFDSASSEQVEAALCEELSKLRLARNLTQKQLASLAGVSPNTIYRLESGQGTSLDTFIRLLKVLGISGNLANLVPDQSVRPLERIERSGKQRQRARPTEQDDSEEGWTWGDD